jgi:hypothetical protein
MSLISNIIIGTPVLPNRFISYDYDKFLFFDFFLRENEEFFYELQDSQDSLNMKSGIDVFYTQTLDFLGSASFNESWSKKIKFIDKELVLKKECLGIIVAEHDRNWIIVQDMPVNLGVFAFKKNSVTSMELFDSIDRSWFVSIDDFKNAEVNPDSLIHESHDAKFIETLIYNYQ